MSDEMESMRDHIDALEATKARQEVRVPLTWCARTLV